MFRIQHSGIIFSFLLLFYDIDCYLKIFQFCVILFTILTISSEHCVKSGRIQWVILVCIFLHLDLIRRDTEFSVFGLNTGKWLRIRTLFTQCTWLPPLKSLPPEKCMEYDNAGLTYSQLYCFWKRFYCISLQKMITQALVAVIIKSNFVDWSTSSFKNFWPWSFQIH